MSSTPIDRKMAAEARVRVCRQEIAKLRDRDNRIAPPKLSLHRELHSPLPFENVQLVDEKALRAFLIAHLEAEMLRYESEANRLRFEVITWAEEQRAAMQAEINEFNARRLK